MVGFLGFGDGLLVLGGPLLFAFNSRLLIQTTLVATFGGQSMSAHVDVVVSIAGVLKSNVLEI